MLNVFGDFPALTDPAGAKSRAAAAAATTPPRSPAAQGCAGWSFSPARSRNSERPSGRFSIKILFRGGVNLVRRPGDVVHRPATEHTPTLHRDTPYCCHLLVEDPQTPGEGCRQSPSRAAATPADGSERVRRRRQTPPGGAMAERTFGTPATVTLSPATPNCPRRTPPQSSHAPPRTTASVTPAASRPHGRVRLPPPT